MEYIDILDVYSVCTKDACIVTLTVMIDHEVTVVNGTSVRHPLDKPNEKLAYMIAYARAYQNLANKLMKRANGRIKHVDDMRIANQLRLPRYVDSPIIKDSYHDKSLLKLNNQLHARLAHTDNANDSEQVAIINQQLDAISQKKKSWFRKKPSH